MILWSAHLKGKAQQKFLTSACKGTGPTIVLIVPVYTYIEGLVWADSSPFSLSFYHYIICKRCALGYVHCIISKQLVDSIELLLSILTVEDEVNGCNKKRELSSEKEKAIFESDKTDHFADSIRNI